MKKISRKQNSKLHITRTSIQIKPLIIPKKSRILISLPLLPRCPETVIKKKKIAYLGYGNKLRKKN